MYMINPVSGRHIKVGGKVYNKLVRDKIIADINLKDLSTCAIHGRGTSLSPIIPSTPIISPASQISPISPIKWVGGKRHIASKIVSYFPKCSDYWEPFCGGGSVFIEYMARLYNSNDNTDGATTSFHISDLNAHIINMFAAIRDDVDNLICSLRDIVTEYNTGNTEHKKTMYYEMRDTFNASPSVPVFMFLNKAGFRGLYRENKSGKFNVPFGNYKSINIDFDNLRALHTLFGAFDVSFSVAPYESISPKLGDVVYLDPPYVNTFANYNGGGFDFDKFGEYITQLENYPRVIMSNSPEANDVYDLHSYIAIPVEIREKINASRPGKESKEMIYIKCSDDMVKTILAVHVSFSFDNPVLVDWIMGGQIFTHVHNSKLTRDEYAWGNRVLGNVNPTKMWSGMLGEKIVSRLIGDSIVATQKKIGNLIVDIETQTHYIEVKTRSYSKRGTAGEKIFYAPIKYGNLDKPLRIVVVGFQEVEFRNMIREANDDDMIIKFMDFIGDNDIQYVMASDLLN